MRSNYLVYILLRCNCQMAFSTAHVQISHACDVKVCLIDEYTNKQIKMEPHHIYVNINIY
uniref:Uncharacterized protein n=1 Tax=Arundo donax TaxID=35708 RepID=A0A0A8YV15_ARUDO